MKLIKRDWRTYLTATVLILGSYGCRDVAVPKPRGYFRIDFPSKEYISSDRLKLKEKMPFMVEYPVYGILSDDLEASGNTGWYNIDFPSYKARIYLTYRDVDNDLANLIEETYTMNVKNHIYKADAINEQVICNREDKIYGILYDLKGNTASAVQFYVTDSIKHYLRGSLYFDSEPDADSLAPVIDFFREDIVHLIETLKWK